MPSVAPAPPPAAPASLVQICVDFMLDHPSAVIAVIGLGVSIILYLHGVARNRMEATFKALELIQDKEVRDARFNLRELLLKVRATGDDFASMSAGDRASLSGIVLSFGLVGALARRKRIHKSIFLDAFASSILVNHIRLRAYSAWRDHYRSYKDGTLWKDFDWLAAEARRYLAIQADPSFLYRQFARRGLRKPREKFIQALLDEAADLSSPRRVTAPQSVPTTTAPTGELTADALGARPAPVMPE